MEWTQSTNTYLLPFFLQNFYLFIYFWVEILFIEEQKHELQRIMSHMTTVLNVPLHRHLTAGVLP